MMYSSNSIVPEPSRSINAKRASVKGDRFWAGEERSDEWWKMISYWTRSARPNEVRDKQEERSHDLKLL